MKTMNGLASELVIKKAKKNWRTRCGAFLLAVLAMFYGGQAALGDVVITHDIGTARYDVSQYGRPMPGAESTEFIWDAAGGNRLDVLQSGIYVGIVNADATTSTVPLFAGQDSLRFTAVGNNYLTIEDAIVSWTNPGKQFLIESNAIARIQANDGRINLTNTLDVERFGTMEFNGIGTLFVEGGTNNGTISIFGADAKMYLSGNVAGQGQIKISSRAEVVFHNEENLSSGAARIDIENGTLTLETLATQHYVTTDNKITLSGPLATINVGTDFDSTLRVTNSITGDQSNLNKDGRGTLILAGDNRYTGWTNILKGTVMTTRENNMVNSAGIDLAGVGAKFVIEADQTIRGLRGGTTTGTVEPFQDDVNRWTRFVQIGSNKLTLDADQAGTQTLYGNIQSDVGGVLIVRGISGGTVFESGFLGYNGGFDIQAGTLRTLSDVTITALDGRVGSRFDVNGKSLTVNIAKDQRYEGLFMEKNQRSYTYYDVSNPFGTLVKEGAGTLTANFSEAANIGFFGSLTIKQGTVVSLSNYYMAGGSTLTFHAPVDGAPIPTLDVASASTATNPIKGVFARASSGGKSYNTTVDVVSDTPSATWKMSNGNNVVGRILGTEWSDYSGLVAGSTNSLFNDVSLETVYPAAGRKDLLVYVNVHGFASLGNTYNTRSVSRNIDNIRVLDLSQHESLATIIQDMWAMGSNVQDDADREHRQDVMLGLFQQLSGDTIANAVFLGLDSPWKRPFDRLNLDSQMVYVSGPQGATIANMRNLWFTPTAQAVHSRSDGNARGYDISRPGYQLGWDKRVAQNTSVGFMLGYSSPVLRQKDDRVEGHDYQFGLYAGAMVGNYVEVKGFVGFGHQSFKSNRTVYMPTDKLVPDTFGMRSIGAPMQSQSAHGRFEGDTFNFSLEVARPLFLGFVIMRPTLGLDSEHANRYSFSETGDAIAMRFGRSQLSRTRARIALGFETCTFERAIFTGRLGYSANLGGHDFAKTTGQFVGIYAPNQTIRSVATGTSFFDAGVGVKTFLNPAKTLSLVGGYDASVADHWVEHRANVSVVYVY